MPKRTLSLIVSTLAAVSLLAAGCGSDPDISDSAPTTTVAPGGAGVDLTGKPFEDMTASATVQVDATDNLFKPAYIVVKAGTVVTFRNDGRNSHNVIPVVEGSFGEIPTDGFEPEVEVPVTFDEPGDYAYYCSLHGTTTKGMVGAIRVEG